MNENGSVTTTSLENTKRRDGGGKLNLIAKALGLGRKARAMMN
jgi:hypothetical protein